MMPPISTRQFITTASQFQSVLDLGCGDGQLLNRIKSPRRVGVDICLEALKVARSRIKKGSGLSFLQADLTNTATTLALGKFECVCGMDVLEHLEKASSLQLLQCCVAMATKCIMFFVPTGHCPYKTDQFGYNNEYHMTHKSTWQPTDMANLGYEVWHFPDWHKKHKGLKPGWSRAAMWCWRLFGDPTWQAAGQIHEGRRYR
jgi:SAM-dependent methyltransferase